MNYNDKIQLPDELYEKTLSSVKSAISKHNKIQKKRKTVLLSAAACFVVFVCSISVLKYFGQNNTINNIETTANSTINPQKNDQTIKIVSDETKYPYKIIIDNKIYSQYYLGDEKADKGNNIELKQSEISELICQLDYFNLTDDLSNFKPMSSEKAKTNKFYKAKVYKYAPAKSDNIIIVQVKDEYYMFYLDGLTTEFTVEELLNEYTANGVNEVVAIEIWQDELYNYTIDLPEAEDITEQGVRPLLVGTIKDKKQLQSILEIIANNNGVIDNNSSDCDKGSQDQNSLMSERGEYELHLVFANTQELNLNGVSLNITIKNNYFYFDVCNKENSLLFGLESADYNKLLDIIRSAI